MVFLWLSLSLLYCIEADLVVLRMRTISVGPRNKTDFSMILHCMSCNRVIIMRRIVC